MTPLSLEGLRPLIHASFLPSLKAFEAWIIAERYLSYRTWTTYVSDLKQAFQFLILHKEQEVTAHLLTSLTLSDFRAFLAYRVKNGVSKRTNARGLSALRTFARFLREREGINIPGLEFLRTPKRGRPLPRPISQENLFIWLQDYTPTDGWETVRNRALFTLLYGAGLRISEALRLNQQDIPLSWQPELCLRILGKGQKERRVPLLKEVHEELCKMRAVYPFSLLSQTPLFLSTRGKRMHASSAANIMADWRAQYGLPANATPHSLRHSFASHLLENGANLRHIQELLGHASLQATQVYLDTDTQHLLNVYATCHPLEQKRSDQQ